MKLKLFVIFVLAFLIVNNFISQFEISHLQKAMLQQGNIPAYSAAITALKDATEAEQDSWETASNINTVLIPEIIECRKVESKFAVAFESQVEFDHREHQRYSELELMLWAIAAQMPTNIAQIEWEPIPAAHPQYYK